MDNNLLHLILEDIKELKGDVKTLLAFKWQIIGGATVISTLVSVLVSLATALLTK